MGFSYHPTLKVLPYLFIDLGRSAFWKWLKDHFGTQVKLQIMTLCKLFYRNSKNMCVICTYTVQQN